MNIIFVCMEAGGASSIGPLISQMYEVFTGKRVFWNWEISRLIAMSNDYIFPKGFSSVFYVDPKKVLERPFDKVILLQRPLEEIRADIHRRLERLKFKVSEEVDRKVDYYYDLIYNQEIEDERLFRIKLQEFANYPVALFSDLFDFLGFPKKHRPMLFPFPIWHHSEAEAYTPEVPMLRRDWHKRSTILRKGHEEGIIEKDEYTQFVNINMPNPYKLTPEEHHYQDGQVYRIGRGTKDTLEVINYFK